MRKDNKTIGITIRFFTNDLPGRVGSKKDQTLFWTCGNVHLEANKTKGIKPQKKKPKVSKSETKISKDLEDLLN